MSRIFNINIRFIALIFFILHALMFWKTPFLFGSPEEKLYALQAAKNFSVNGFFATNGLSNYARTDAEPAIYSHLIDLSAYIIYLINFIDVNFAFLKLFFFILILGCFYVSYVISKKFVPDQWAFVLATFSVIAPKVFVIWSEVHWPMTLLCINLTGLITIKLLETHSKKYFFLYQLNLIFASFISWFAAVGVLATSFAIKLFFKKEPILRPLFLNSLLVFLTMVCIKLGWNASYFGLQNEIEEIRMTITNRIYGYPSSLEMQDFFNSSGIVVWGAAGVNGKVLLHYFLNLAFSLLLPLILICIALIFIKKNKNTESKLLILFLAFFGQIAWAILFPAHMVGYGNIIFYTSLRFFFALLTVLIFSNVLQALPKASGKSALNFQLMQNNKIFKKGKIELKFGIRRSLEFTGSIFVCVIFYYITTINWKFFSYSKQGFEVPSIILEKIDKKVVYTNMSSIYLSYNSDSALVSGRCSPEAFLFKSPAFCLNNFEKVKENFSVLSEPKYFVFNQDYRSGNTLWSSDEELVKFQKVLDKHLIKVLETNDVQNSSWILYQFK